MLRQVVRRLGAQLGQAAATSAEVAGARRGSAAQLAHEAFARRDARGFASAPAHGGKPDFEHATGLELKELEAAAKGDNLFEQDLKWLNEPLGTAANPVRVTSTLSSRIVGATDGDDDSIIHWGLVEEGKPPVRIGEEFFVLHRVADAAGAHGAAHH